MGADLRRFVSLLLAAVAVGLLHNGKAHIGTHQSSMTQGRGRKSPRSPCAIGGHNKRHACLSQQARGDHVEDDSSSESDRFEDDSSGESDHVEDDRADSDNDAQPPEDLRTRVFNPADALEALLAFFSIAPTLWIDKFSTREEVLAAVRRNGIYLRFASNALKRDPELILAAVSSQGQALQFADLNAFLGDGRTERHQWLNVTRVVMPIFMAAVANDGHAMQHLPIWARANRDIIIAACNNTQGAWRHAPNLVQAVLHSRRKDRALIAALLKSEFPFEGLPLSTALTLGLTCGLEFFNLTKPLDHKLIAMLLGGHDGIPLASFPKRVQDAVTDVVRVHDAMALVGSKLFPVPDVQRVVVNFLAAADVLQEYRTARLPPRSKLLRKHAVEPTTEALRRMHAAIMPSPSNGVRSLSTFGFLLWLHVIGVIDVESFLPSFLPYLLPSFQVIMLFFLLKPLPEFIVSVAAVYLFLHR